MDLRRRYVVGLRPSWKAPGGLVERRPGAAGEQRAASQRAHWGWAQAARGGLAVAPLQALADHHLYHLDLTSQINKITYQVFLSGV